MLQPHGLILGIALQDKGASNRSNKIGNTNIITLGLYSYEEESNCPVADFCVICSMYLAYLESIWIMSMCAYVWYMKTFKEIKNAVFEQIKYSY